jgi:hypothetical protein
VQGEDLAPVALDDVREDARESAVLLGDEGRMLEGVHECAEPRHPGRALVGEESVEELAIIGTCGSNEHPGPRPG